MPWPRPAASPWNVNGRTFASTSVWPISPRVTLRQIWCFLDGRAGVTRCPRTKPLLWLFEGVLPMPHYDAIVIGAGQAGNPMSQKLADLGWAVALVEKEYLGGTCVNTGCTPTKTMMASAQVAYYART